MTPRSWKIAGAVAALTLSIAACKTNDSSAPAAAGEVNAGTTTGGSDAGGTAGTGSGVPALVSVDLRNVLNNLSVDLKVNRNNIPVTAQVPIDVAANVCGVDVNVLAASVASGHATCTASTTTPQLTQAVQQQIASGGSVTGGDQTMGSPTNNISD